MVYFSTTITQNGLPVVATLNGTEFMTSSDAGDPRVSYSVYLVVFYDPTNAEYADIIRAGSNSVPVIDIHGNVWTSFPPGANGRVGFGSFNAVADYPAAATGWQILHFHLDLDAGTGAIYRNATLLDDTLSYVADVGQTDGDWTIGWAATEHLFTGAYAEIAIYRGDRPHNAGERDAKVAELNTKWAIFIP